MKQVYFKLTQKNNPVHPEQGPKLYATRVPLKTVTAETLAEELVNRSGISEIDAFNAINGLTFILAEHLSNGDTVDFGRLGRFFITLSSKGVVEGESLAQKDIRIKRVAFRPGTAIKKSLNDVQFVDIKNVKALKGIRPDQLEHAIESMEKDVEVSPFADEFDGLSLIDETDNFTSDSQTEE